MKPSCAVFSLCSSEQDAVFDYGMSVTVAGVDETKIKPKQTNKKPWYFRLFKKKRIYGHFQQLTNLLKVRKI